MSEDEDYMSSAFLEIQEDIRPGLLPKSVKRKLEIEKKRTESNEVFRTKSRKLLEEESRNVGLNSAIGSDNKGFALLQKMGYKPGMKLGPEKRSDSGSGLIEPIKIEVKTNRKGLGREDEIRRRIEEREERRQKLKVYHEQETKAMTEEFRERMKSKIDDRRLMKDLRKCQKTCEQLDVENGITEPMRSWFWYSSSLERENDDDNGEEQDCEEEEEEEELSLEEKIGFITDYIRPKYFYCSWCCIKYDNEEDMNLNCPGPDKSCHDDFLD
ncbi:G patch domain-containing protein 11-like [Argiope bruennichi]|uniref:G patch domain-containing protein 11 n=1 Tax=Argiope bruennichi TaxID=94029 RepID=A0A8T0G1V5_ARGBR|nr:G patch domain-containing protein 11-like [Argiope bruennichi]XP_055947354.1 G patch domain-containing protein 11-like [Argiope bruennichi]XP_055947356.1 G patch domain-containing protein 11-like [Argiope bruennichi]KAF8797294.1 G patch domain-containing protein 11 [Argiope bruennichi]